VSRIDPTDIPSGVITCDKLGPQAVTTYNIQQGAITAAQLNPQLLSDLQDAKLPTNYSGMLMSTNEHLTRAIHMIEDLVKRVDELEDTIQDQALREAWARNRGL